MKCHFCGQGVTQDGGGGPSTETRYHCLRCGNLFLSQELLGCIKLGIDRFSDDDAHKLSIMLRNDYEKAGYKYRRNELTPEDLENFLSLYRQKDPIEQIDIALLNFEKASKYLGAPIEIDFENDYPLYYCRNGSEARAICTFTQREGFTEAPDPKNPHWMFRLTAKCYERLREIKRSGKQSRQCFVAMWFGEELNEAYDRAIRPAIEYIEPGETEPRFEALVMNRYEHINEINDEIIAQIRRSRFMVCDLTGYRGGVYFEAGFAYGLGLDVIYTCRKDWADETTLTDENGKTVETLYDQARKPIHVRKEGIHFDLASWNRIEWEPEPDKLEDFRRALEHRIRAVIL